MAHEPNDENGHDQRHLTERLHAAVDGVSAPADLIEVEHGARRLRTRRRAALGVAAAMLVAGAAGAGFGIGRAATDSGGQVASPAATPSPSADATDDSDAEPAAPDASFDHEGALVPTTEPPVPTTVLAPFPPDSEVSASLDAELSYGAGWRAGYDLLVDRSLESGLHLRVQRGESYGGGYWEPDQTGWAPEPWCYDESEGRVAVAAADLIDVGWFPYRNAGFPGILVTPVDLGWADGEPVRILIVQSATATEATVVHESGSDTGHAVDGLIALALVGDSHDAEYELTVATPEGPVVLGTGEGYVYSSPEWRESCEPPPPALPEPGEQPADPAAAEAEVRATFDLLYDNSVPLEDKPLHLLDDWTGVDEARDAIAAGGFADTAATATLTLEELVFTSPTSATYRYRIDADTGTFRDRFGTASEIDGHWRIARESYCQDLSLAGGYCDGLDDVFFSENP